MNKSKYGNRKTTVNGITFDSKKEANRYCELRVLMKSGYISDLRLQVPFVLAPAANGERSVKYVADFVYMENEKQIVEDVKGYRTKEYVVKRKWFKSKYCSDDVVFREV